MLLLLGQNYAALGDSKKALDYAKQALNIALKSHGDKHVLYGLAMSNVGSIYSRLGMFDEAEDYFRQSLVILDKEIYQKGDKKSYSDFASTLSQVGIISLAKGKEAEARPFFEKLILVKAGQAASDYQLHMALASGYANAGDMWFEVNHQSEAQKCYEKGLTLYESYKTKDPVAAKNNIGTNITVPYPSLVIAMNRLSLIYDKNGKKPDAEKLQKEAQQWARFHNMTAEQLNP